MRREAIVREAWRNVAGGTSRAILIAFLLAIVVLGAQLGDLLTVRGIVERVDTFRSSGADIRILSAVGRIDPGLCEQLAAQPTVLAAGAVRTGTPRYAATLPASSIPTFTVTPGFPSVLSSGGGAGVTLSRDLADTLGLAPGDEVTLLDGATSVAGVYDYPQDGRMPGYGYAMLSPTSAQAPFDACWVREWPLTEQTELLLRGVLVPRAAAPDDPAPELGQLNSSLGRTLDATALFAGRVTRWTPLAAFALAALIAAGAMRLRRLELAAGQHLGVSRSDQVAIALLEAVAWVAPVLVLGAVAAAAVAATGSVADVGATLLLGALAPVGGALGTALGAALGTLTVRERDLLRFFKER